MAAFLIAPAVWSGYSVVYGSHDGLPSAGPQVAGAHGPFSNSNATALNDDGGAAGPPVMAQADQSGLPGQAEPTDGPPRGGPGGSASAALVSYLEANQGPATYLVATTNSTSAASIILASHRPVTCWAASRAVILS